MIIIMTSAVKAQELLDIGEYAVFSEPNSTGYPFITASLRDVNKYGSTDIVFTMIAKLKWGYNVYKGDDFDETSKRASGSITIDLDYAKEDSDAAVGINVMTNFREQMVTALENNRKMYFGGRVRRGDATHNIGEIKKFIDARGEYPEHEVIRLGITTRSKNTGGIREARVMIRKRRTVVNPTGYATEDMLAANLTRGAIVLLTLQYKRLYRSAGKYSCKPQVIGVIVLKQGNGSLAARASDINTMDSAMLNKYGVDESDDDDDSNNNSDGDSLYDDVI